MKTIYLLHFAILFIACTASAGIVHIRGTVGHSTEENLQCTVVSSSLQTKHSIVVIPMQDGRFYHQFELSMPTFLSFSDGTNYFGGFVEPGDSIVINYDRLDFDNSFTYSGTGKEKFEIAYSINQIRAFPRKHQAVAKTNSFPVDYMFSKIDSLKETASTRIALSSMSRESNAQLLGMLAAAELLAKRSSLVAIFGDSYNAILANHREKLSNSSIERMQKLWSFDEAHYKSRFYIEAVHVITAIHLEEDIQPVTSNFAGRKYEFLAQMVPGKLRSSVIFLELKSDLSDRTGEINEPVIRNAADQLTDPLLKETILDMLAGTRMLRVGDNAPDFSVRNLSGEKVNLASFHGKTIYLDFWFATCGPCHLLFKALEPVKKQFEHDDRVVFLTVSVDNESAWKKAIAKFGVKGYHVFTENKLREHPIIQSYNIGAYPTTYIIDPAGKFHSIRPSQNPDILSKEIEESIRTSGK